MRKKGEREREREKYLLKIKSKMIQEDKEEQDADVKDKEGTQPKKYYKGLDKKTKEKKGCTLQEES